MNYKDIIADYKILSQNLQEIEKLYDKFLSKIDRNIVIEIGIDRGGSAKIWESFGFKEYIGIDFSINRINWCREICPEFIFIIDDIRYTDLIYKYNYDYIENNISTNIYNNEFTNIFTIINPKTYL